MHNSYTDGTLMEDEVKCLCENPNHTGGYVPQSILRIIAYCTSYVMHYFVLCYYKINYSNWQIQLLSIINISAN